MPNEVICGDCLQELNMCPSSNFDAVITDPPYGIKFMGKSWDYDIPSKEHFSEFMRVCKPGAYLMCFSSPRTMHRMMCNIEDAGWEIRDCIMWVYGSGFPHGSNVAKMIDKMTGYEGEVIGQRQVDTGMQGGHMHAGRELHVETQDVRALSDQAAPWDGWNTALKPAWEPIIMARKPLEGTVAENVLKYGTGAINVDACRIGTDTIVTQGGDKFPKLYGDYATCEESTHQGRFPANVIHDGSDEVMALFPYAKGNTHSIKRSFRNGQHNTYGNMPYRADYQGFADSGGSAARFFYCAKASTAERGEGNDHPTVKPLKLMEYLVKMVTREDAFILDPYCGSGTTLLAARNLNRRYIGIEKDPHYVKIAERRLKEDTI